MSLADELAVLFRRDLTRLGKQVRAFADADAIWQATPGMTNPPGNLVLHLEGNLREYIGRQLGSVAYTRHRDDEFALTGIAAADLATRVDELTALIPPIVAALTSEQLDATYPEPVLGSPIATRHFLIHLNGHLNYHLGQIDVQRRAHTGEGAIPSGR